MRQDKKYKVVTDFSDNDFITNCEGTARDIFNDYREEYGNVKMYESVNNGKWFLIDYEDKKIETK